MIYNKIIEATFLAQIIQEAQELQVLQEVQAIQVVQEVIAVPRTKASQIIFTNAPTKTSWTKSMATSITPMMKKSSFSKKHTIAQSA